LASKFLTLSFFRNTLIDKDKLHTKFSALNIDFDGTSLVFKAEGNLRTRASKSSTPVKVVILPMLASESSMIKIADRHGHAVYHNKH